MVPFEPEAASALVHCFGCDTVVTVRRDHEVPWCPTCEGPLLGPGVDKPTMRWSTEDDLPTLSQDAVDEAPLRTPRRSTSMAAAGMLGLQQALFGPIEHDDPITFVQDSPDGDDELEVHLDEAPTRSWIRLRRHR